MPTAASASFTASVLNGLIIASIFFTAPKLEPASQSASKWDFGLARTSLALIEHFLDIGSREPRIFVRHRLCGTDSRCRGTANFNAHSSYPADQRLGSIEPSRALELSGSPLDSGRAQYQSDLQTDCARHRLGRSPAAD